MRVLLLLALSLVACARSAAPALPTWLAGGWSSDDGAVEHWHHVGGALVGVGFPAGGPAFEVMIVQGPPVTFTAWPGGEGGVVFTAQKHDASQVVFANPAHDFPREVGYRRDGDTLTAYIGKGGGERSAEYRWRRATSSPAPALEAADRGAPRASGLSPRGDLGYTVGEAGSGAYVTIWRRQDDGSWKVLFATQSSAKDAVRP